MAQCKIMVKIFILLPTFLATDNNLYSVENGSHMWYNMENCKA